MKKLQAGLILGVAGLMLTAATAQAVPFRPHGDLFIKFNGIEQVSPTAAITLPDGTPTGESNWGIAALTVIDEGFVTEANSTIGDNTAVLPIYSNLKDFGAGPSQITAMFYGVTPSSNVGPAGTFNSTGGFIDLYYDTGTIVNIAALLPSGRTGVSTFTGVTDGEFLARLKFDTGIISGDGVTTIQGSGPAFGSATGTNVADSYVSQVNGAMVGGVLGAWDGVFDTNWFTMYPAATGGGPILDNLGPVVRDMRFKNSFNTANPAWSAPGVLGFALDDPAQASAVIPEPASMLLLGTGLAGLAGISRRRRKKNQA